ncbi:hypothetical protein [Microbacterium sp. Se63.02b]|uniref:hypothetical protein n=1 Tax=Microbacterium sp. Se63.02b TaxID=2709304 RepID=UPI001605204F|nr:hypothetical protein [Microbacterium sp. Se63.02b]QNA93105.1 hypothetical protein G4G29_13555 [Microbacterium sp. Se63.02b]
MDSIAGDEAQDNPALWSRRSVLRMLVIAGVLPPVLGSQTGNASAAVAQLTTTEASTPTRSADWTSRTSSSRRSRSSWARAIG